MEATQMIRKILTTSTFDVFEKMFFITSWGPGRRGCFYQEDLGPQLELQKQAIAAVP